MPSPGSVVSPTDPFPCTCQNLSRTALRPPRLDDEEPLGVLIRFLSMTNRHAAFGSLWTRALDATERTEPAP